MLIGYSLGEKVSQNIFLDLEDEARFADSGLRQVPMERGGMRCEAYFYDALLAKAGGDNDRMKSSLKKAGDTGFRSYFESGMAKFLLAQEMEGKLILKCMEYRAWPPKKAR